MLVIRNCYLTNAVVATTFVLTLCAVVAPAQARPLVASDVASNAAYDDGWTTGDNGGFGFLPWQLSAVGSGGGSAGNFIGTSNNNGGSLGGGIDTGGESFGLYANSGGAPTTASTAIRPFASVLSVGSTFSFAYDNGFIGAGVAPQVRLADASGLARLTFQFVGGGENYSVIDNSGTVNFGNGAGAGNLGGFSGDGLLGIFTLTGTNTYSLQVTRQQSGQTATISGTLAGTANAAIDRTIIFTNAQGGGGDGDYFVNSLAINTPTVVPEAGTMALLGMASLVALPKLARRRVTK